MTVKGVLLRFFLGYIALSVIVGVVLNALKIDIGSAVNTGIIIGLIYWVCLSFGKVNGRYFTKQEKTTTVIGLISIDVALQLVFSLLVMTNAKVNIGSNILVFALVFTAVLHGILIYYLVGACRKHLVRIKAINA